MDFSPQIIDNLFVVLSGVDLPAMKLKKEKLVEYKNFNQNKNEATVFLSKLGKDRYWRLFRSFRALCANKELDSEDEGCFYVTEASFRDNFCFVFGHDNTLMRDRLLDLVFDNTCKPRIYLGLTHIAKV